MNKLYSLCPCSEAARSEPSTPAMHQVCCSKLCRSAALLVLALLSVVRIVSAQSASAACPDGMVHYFGFDERTSSTSFQDYKSATTATCTACPSPTQGLFSGALHFDGDNDGLNIADIKNFEWGPNSSFSIELWMKSDGTLTGSNHVMIGRDAQDSDVHWWIGVNKDGRASFELRDRKRNGFNLSDDAGKRIDDGKWHHIGIVRDGINRLNKLYVDGYAAGVYRFDYSDNFESVSPVNIGYLDLNDGYHYKGALDEVIVYGKALSENEMRTRYNQGAGSYCGPELFAPTIMSDPVTYGVAGQVYNYTLVATGNESPVFKLLQAPAGMTINAGTGEISWVPQASGDFTVEAEASNASGKASQKYRITVKKGLDEQLGMIHHWMLNETSGTRYHDFYTPYDATTEADTKPAPVMGVVSGGQLFDGVNNGLEVQESRNFNWKPDADFSIELWLKTTATPTRNLVMIGRNARDSDVHWWVGMDPGGHVGFELKDISWSGTYIGNAGPAVNDGLWHQVVAVRNGADGTNKLYVDGQLTAQTSIRYQNSFASLTPVNIGYLDDGDGYYFNGTLDEVKLFGRAMSGAEIKNRFDEVYDAIIDLISFTGTYTNGTVLLNWETATETALSHFEVERSADGEEFVKIGEVDAAGNSNNRLSYSFTDSAPLSGRSFYRLRILKESGAQNYSNIVEISNEQLIASTVTLYPNPTTGGTVTVDGSNLPPDEDVVLLLTDMTGRQLLQKNILVEASGQLHESLEIGAALRPGIYNLTLIMRAKTISRKLVVAH